MTALSVLLGWLVAGRALRSLQHITATARRVSQDNLDERIALEGPRDELKELADTFDAMLERLQAAFASQRRFVANASHELRTPLSVMRTELEVTLADPQASNAELRAMAETVHEALDHTERLVQALLTLARSEGAVTRRDPLDLADAARLALDHTTRDAQATNLDVAADLNAAPVCGDRRLLERLVANLVENAVRHNRAGGRVSVSTSTRDGRSVVEVVNDGDVLDPATLPRLMEPFQRIDRGVRGDGAGLGLSIVRSVAQAHGGSVALAACSSGGLRATVTLPRGEPTDPADPSRYSRERAHA
jgi:signal transduction histidine kinase